MSPFATDNFIFGVGIIEHCVVVANDGVINVVVLPVSTNVVALWLLITMDNVKVCLLGFLFIKACIDNCSTAG
jgi:hypothetical protein